MEFWYVHCHITSLCLFDSLDKSILLSLESGFSEQRHFGL